MKCEPEAMQLPATLLPDRVRTGEEEWFVLHVRSRQEKVLLKALRGLGIDGYLPLRKEVTYHGKRKVRIERPFFPGYLFLWGSIDQAYAADRTSRVVGLIRVDDQERLEWELRSIFLAQRNGAPVAACSMISEGERVVVRSGPFKGLEGMVQKRGRADRLILQVSTIGSAMSLEIEESLLTPIS